MALLSHHPRPSWPSSDDQTGFNLIVVAIGICVFGYLLWTNFHGQISAAVIAWRHREMLLPGHFTDRFARADAEMLHANPDWVSLRDLYGISHAIGAFWRIPACAFIGLLAVVCTLRAAPSRFKRRFDLEGLVREQLKFFPAGAALFDRKLRLTPPAEGAPLPGDFALTAEEWVERFGCDVSGVFDEARARRALAAQLGPRWTGPENASPAPAVIFVCFALHLTERREEAIELLGGAAAALASSDGPPREPLVLAGEVVRYASQLLRDPEAFSAAREVAACHAYTAPALMRLLNAARLRSGVLAPAQFAWLKLVDRSLWYALHSLGFETGSVGRYLHPNPRVEALGARDHWAVECAASAPVIEPDLARAIEALRRHAQARAAAQQRLRGFRRKGGGEPRAAGPVRRFANRNADGLGELLASVLDEQAENDAANGVFRARGDTPIDIIKPVLEWLRDHKGVTLDREMIGFSVDFHWIWKLVTEKTALLPEIDSKTGTLKELRLNEEIPEDLIAPLRRYLFGSREDEAVRTGSAYRAHPSSSFGVQQS